MEEKETDCTKNINSDNDNELHISPYIFLNLSGPDGITSIKIKLDEKGRKAVEEKMKEYLKEER